MGRVAVWGDTGDTVWVVFTAVVWTQGVLGGDDLVSQLQDGEGDERCWKVMPSMAPASPRRAFQGIINL